MVGGLGLEERRLFLDEQQLGAGFRKVREGTGLQRPDQRGLVDGNTERCEPRRIQAERVQRLDDVEPALSCRNYTQGGCVTVNGSAVGDTVKSIFSNVGVDARKTLSHMTLFVAERVERQSPVDIIGVPGRRWWYATQDPARVHLDDAGGLHRLVDALEPDPSSGVPGQCVAMQAEIQILLHARRIQHRNAVCS